MIFQSENSDILLAQQICDELRSGNTEALSVLYHRYNAFFSIFACQRLFASVEYPVDNVLSEFWMELLNAKAICDYEGKAALRSYLTLILSRRIIDANRKIKREKTAKFIFEAQRDSISDNDHLQRSPEDDLIKKELQTLLHEALLLLAETSPNDANLIRMHLEGMTYAEMAEREMQGQKSNAKKLKQKTDSIKKQFTRDDTGSMAKFKKILNKSMKKNALNFNDLLN
jgi:RNA polymerase sigma-70 factor (ECF subfamily)